MAKKETVNLVETFAEFKEQKNIDHSTLIGVLEESIRKVIINLFGSGNGYEL